MIEPRHCPFCGGAGLSTDLGICSFYMEELDFNTQEKKEEYPVFTSVYCYGCGAIGPGIINSQFKHSQLEEEAIKAWNQSK